MTKAPYPDACASATPAAPVAPAASATAVPPRSDAKIGGVDADYFGVQIPFMAHIGLIPELFSPDLTRTRLPYSTQISNSRGEIHGGTLMSALDFTLSAAARANDPSTGMATISMTTQFIAPARGTVVFETHCLRMGRSLAFCEGRALDERGKLLATATATFKIVRPSRHGKEQAS